MNMLRILFVESSIALRSVLREPRRSGMAVAAVAFGTTALILASGFIEWIFLDFRESTIQSRLGHLQITRPGYHDSGKADPYAFLLPAEIAPLGPAVQADTKAIAPRLTFSGLVSRGDATLSFIGEGVSPADEEFLRHGFTVSAGADLSADDPRSIIVGEGLARNLGVTIGSRVVLLVTTATGGTNGVEVSVRGLFSTVTKAFDDAALRIPLTTARELLRTQGSHTWIILLDETAKTDTAARAIRATLPQDQFEVTPWYKLADLYNKTEALFTKQVRGIQLIIGLIIVLSISNTMTMNVLQRVSEIGTSMALGVKRAGILRLFLVQGIIVGCIGGLLGVLAGIILAKVISAIGVPMPPPPGMSHGYIGEVLVTRKIALESFCIAIGTALVASVYPAWSASRKEIVDALRHNR
jgi:putative ABC transport system permease protein